MRLSPVSPRVVLATNLLVAAAGLGWMLWRWGAPAFARLAEGPCWALLAAFVVTVALALAGHALRWRIVLDGLGPAPGIGALTAFGAAGQSVATVVPSARLGGEPLRAWLLLEGGVPAPSAIAGVAVDRLVEVAAGLPFSVAFAVLLARRGVPALESTVATLGVAVVGLAAGVAVLVRRLRRGRGVVTAMARSTGLDRVAAVERRMGLLASAEACAGRLVAQPRRIGAAFAIAVAGHAVVLLEAWLLLRAFGLPAEPIAVVAAVFAAGAAHAMPVPAGVGVLEGGEMLLFQALGHPPAVGLAAALAVRLREVVWIAPGFAYLCWRGLAVPGRRPQTAPARNPG